jgi:hypothetical protein
MEPLFGVEQLKSFNNPQYKSTIRYEPPSWFKHLESNQIHLKNSKDIVTDDIDKPAGLKSCSDRRLLENEGNSMKLHIEQDYFNNRVTKRMIDEFTQTSDGFIISNIAQDPISITKITQDPLIPISHDPFKIETALERDFLYKFNNQSESTQKLSSESIPESSKLQVITPQTTKLKYLPQLTFDIPFNDNFGHFSTSPIKLEQITNVDHSTFPIDLECAEDGVYSIANDFLNSETASMLDCNVSFNIGILF